MAVEDEFEQLSAPGDVYFGRAAPSRRMSHPGDTKRRLGSNAIISLRAGEVTVVSSFTSAYSIQLRMHQNHW